MQNLLKPKWLLLINTLPIVLIFMIFIGQYNILYSQFKPENIEMWQSFGMALAIMGLCGLLYAAFLMLKHKEVNLVFALLLLFSHIAFIYLFFENYIKFIPVEIPDWMMPANLFMYVASFLMPTLAYAMFIIITKLTPRGAESKAWKNFVVAILIPLAWYLFFQVLAPLRRAVMDTFNTHVLIMVAIVSILVFFFFLARWIYIITLKKSKAWAHLHLLFYVLISLILPIIGLALNNGEIKPFGGVREDGIFGNFHNPWFYILTIINAVLVCLPQLEKRFYRLVLFIGRSVTFAFTLYFFIVFLPFLPLAIPAIISLGVGFLLLAPLLLFIIHVNKLSEDLIFLKAYFKGPYLSLVSVLAMLVIPACITLSYMHEKRVLGEALDYVYQPDYAMNYDIDKSTLAKTLEIVKQHKSHNGFTIFEEEIPYLSGFYKWIVLDNMTITNDKINYMEQVFYGEPNYRGFNRTDRGSEDVKISKVTSSSGYNAKSNSWISKVDIEIHNGDENGLGEYVSSIDLPAGCWISDYYLYVGDKKEPGILAEKKSATWIYNEIRNVNRDPGIMYYTGGNRVMFKVFPFAGNETRKTGFELIHKEPVQLNLDGHTLQLGQKGVQENVAIAESKNKDAVYISSNAKRSLEKVCRKPYYHFMVDVSADKKPLVNSYITRIETLLSKNPLNRDKAMISFCNTYCVSFPLDKDNSWKQHINNQDFSGGYFLERAIKKTFYKAINIPDNSYPVIVCITDNMQQAILDNDFSEFRQAYPESGRFYHLDDSGRMIAHSLVSNPRTELADNIPENMNDTVLAFPDSRSPIAYLSNNGQADIVLRKTPFEISESDIHEKDWQSSLAIHAKWMSSVMYPEMMDKEWPLQVKYSFLAKVMTPYTSYIVLENEAQRKLLLKKQQDVLSGKASLDVGADAQRMSEPELWILLTLLCILLWFGKKKKAAMNIN